MPFVRAGQLARPTPVLNIEMPIGLVAENLRAAGCGALPVLDRLITGGTEDGPGGPQWNLQARQARVVGVVDERNLSLAVLPVLEEQEITRRALPIPVAINGHAPVENKSQSPFWPEAPQEDVSLGGVGADASVNQDAPLLPPLAELTSLTARDVMQRDFGIVPSLFSLHNALITLDRYNAAALPVIDPDGSYRGMVSRADIVAALGRNVRPPVVGGMATPLGVWLTTGTVTGGAPPLGLYLSGALLGFCFLASYFGVLLTLTAINSDWAAMFVSGRLGASSYGGWFNLLSTAAQGLVFLLAMRALPLSGVHAAEHQTVWAIERGLPLTPEIVAQMPRAHPRCGTNLMALSVLITIIFQHLPTFDPTVILLTLIFIYFSWRSFGEMLQNYFTTKPATPKQIESGIRAGREVLEKYQDQPHLLPPFGVRLLRSGLIYSALGMMTVMGLFWALSKVATWAMELR
ncbi:MAG TPA: DUF1385 domain-containing protein [Abditibacteriaceae bacterium]|jgi:hypothetical protein